MTKRRVALLITRLSLVRFSALLQFKASISRKNYNCDNVIPEMKTKANFNWVFLSTHNEKMGFTEKGFILPWNSLVSNIFNIQLIFHSITLMLGILYCSFHKSCTKMAKKWSVALIFQCNFVLCCWSIYWSMAKFHIYVPAKWALHSVSRFSIKAGESVIL